MTESVDAWWSRRQWTKGREVPYPIGSYRSEWERYPALVRQYHPELNYGITLTQIPPAAEVYLSWQCEYGHIFVATPQEQRNRPGPRRRRSVWCPDCAELANPTRVRAAPRDSWPEHRPVTTTRSKPITAAAPGEAFWSAHAPKPASAAEGELRQRLRDRFEFDLSLNAIALSRPFFERLEAWPDIVIPELRVAIEYDTIGRHGLEHVGTREQSDRQKDRVIRATKWEVVRIRCGKLQPIGPYDIHASAVNARLVARLDEILGTIRGDLIVSAYRRA